MRIHFRFHVRPKWRKGIERLGSGPLAFAILNGAIADVLSRGVAQNITGSSSGGDVPHAPANDNSKLSLKVRAMIRKWHLDFAAIRNNGSAGFNPNKRLLGNR